MFLNRTSEKEDGEMGEGRYVAADMNNDSFFSRRALPRFRCHSSFLSSLYGMPPSVLTQEPVASARGKVALV